MKRFVTMVFVLALLGAAAYFLYRHFYPDDKARIRAFMTECVSHIEKKSEKSLITEQSDLAFLRSAMAQNIECSIVPYARNLPAERGVLLAGFTAARRNMRTLDLDIVIRDIALNYDSSRRLSIVKVFFTANLKAAFKGDASGISETFDCQANIKAAPDGNLEFDFFHANPVVYK